VQEFSFQGTGGVRIVGNCIAPKETSQVSQIILFHHGLWADIFFPPFQPRLLDALKSEERIVFAYDSRGHGRSCQDFSTGQFGDYFDVEAMVADVSLALNFIFAKFNMIDRKGLEVIVIGHSLGGYVALRAAVSDERIGKVVTISSPLSFSFPAKRKEVEEFLTRFLIGAAEGFRARFGKPTDALTLYKMHLRDMKKAKELFEAAPPIEDFSQELSFKKISFIIGKDDVMIDLFDTRERTEKLAKEIGAKTFYTPGEHGFFGAEKDLVKTVVSRMA
jgi:alpha-beta hydrolase superfamily lysophospholipase